VAIKTGRSDVAKKMVVSHTASLAGSDELVTDLFERLGVARVNSLEALIEALKVLHVLGPLSGGRIGAMSTSGGDLTLLADALGPDLSMPPLSDKVAQDLQAIIHDLMKAANPFDFQMFDWNDEESMARNFTAFMTEKFDVALCLLDYPREDICDQSTWAGAERGFVRATKETGTKAAVLSTFSDTISEEVAERLMKDRVATLAGIDAGVAGIQSAVDVGAAWRRPKSPPLLTGFDNSNVDAIEVLDEAASKRFIAENGVPVPPGYVVGSEDAVEAAELLGYPVVLKALGVAHKTDVGGVQLGLADANAVSDAIAEMSDLSVSFLVERMVQGVVVELIVGVARDEQFGPYLLVGGGGILVEMMRDSVSLLLPTTNEWVLEAFSKLKCAPLLKGFRGAPPADLEAAAEAIMAIAAMVENDPEAIVELDVNPLMVLAKGQGVVAADALICVNQTGKD
jgi:acyl-CoA synthetase (NDP forming)